MYLVNRSGVLFKIAKILFDYQLSSGARDSLAKCQTVATLSPV